jgi:hypothetical protein
MEFKTETGPNRNTLAVPPPSIRPEPKNEGPSLAAKPLFYLAGGQGFEPWLAESESAVLPLDDPPKLRWGYRWLIVGTSGRMVSRQSA